MSNQLLKVALIGRANVGKSTLFNRLTERKQAIVSDIPGTTRDRNYSQVNWTGFDFSLIDTGGLDIVHDKAFEDDVIKQANFALAEADFILFVVDTKTGLMPQDKEVAKLLKKANKPLMVIANKADSQKLKSSTAEFFKLGLSDPITLSAANGSGTGDMLDILVSKLKKIPGAKKSKTKDSIQVAIIGKPNVGKSSIVNAILGQERVITSPTPYTTRDSQDIEFKYNKNLYTLIDTAGVRKRNKIKDRLEKYSVGQSLKSIKRADVTLLVTDVSKTINKQDKTLSEAITESSASLILVANKWDLIPDKDQNTINKYVKYYNANFPYLMYAPIIFTSALENKRVRKILDLAKEVYDERFREISPTALERFIKKLIKKHPPAKGKGTNRPRIFGLKQLRTDPPVFELVKDFKSDLHISYVRFIENQLREKFGFLGTPIIIKVRKLTN